MRFRTTLPVFLLAAAAMTASAQPASAPAGWPKSLPLPPAGAPGVTRTIVEQAPAPALDAEQLAKRFQITGDQVYDRKTDLTWQRCDFGQAWDEANHWCRGVKRHATAEALVEAARADAAGWRVPTIDELSSMMEIACRPQPKDVAPVFAETERSTSGMNYYLSSTLGGSADHVMAQQCFGGSSMQAALGSKFTSITHLVHSGPMAGH